MNRRNLFKGLAGVAGGLAANKVLPKDVDVPIQTKTLVIPPIAEVSVLCTAVPYAMSMEDYNAYWKAK